MALETKLSTDARNASADAVVDLLDAGISDAYIEVRDGAPPVNVSDPDSGTLLATLVMNDPAFGAAVAGVATANAIASDISADASGDAGHFRAKDSDGNTVFQGTAGEAGDTPNMVFDDKSIVEGGVVACTSLTLTVPASE